MIFGSSRTAAVISWNAPGRNAGLFSSASATACSARQRVAPVGVGDVAAGGLGVEPLADVALVRAGALSQLARGQRARAGQRLVEAEPVADHDQRRVQRRAELAHGLEHELLDLRLVDRLHVSHLLGDGVRARPPSAFASGGAPGISASARGQGGARVDRELAVDVRRW